MAWLPIDPRLDPTTKAFAVFSGMKNAQDFKPAPYNGEALSNFHGEANTLSMDVTARLGVTPAVNLSSSYNSFVLTYDAMLYTETNAPVGRPIVATRWGAGFRLAIHTWNVAADLKLSLGVVAASVELGMINASYELAGYGFSNPDILSALPGPGRFDRKMLARVLKAANEVQAYLREHATDGSISPVPFQVLMSTPPLESPLVASQATLFTMRQIAAGRSLQQALASTNASRFDTLVVRSTYAKMVADPAGKPTGGECAYADGWLRFSKH